MTTNSACPASGTPLAGGAGSGTAATSPNDGSGAAAAAGQGQGNGGAGTPTLNGAGNSQATMASSAAENSAKKVSIGLGIISFAIALFL